MENQATHEAFRAIQHPAKGEAVSAWTVLTLTALEPEVSGNTVFLTRGGKRVELTAQQVRTNLQRRASRR